MADTEISEAPADSGAETNTQSITTLEELTASFVDKVEESEAKEESEVTAESETQPTDTETDRIQMFFYSQPNLRNQKRRKRKR